MGFSLPSAKAGVDSKWIEYYPIKRVSRRNTLLSPSRLVLKHGSAQRADLFWFKCLRNKLKYEFHEPKADGLSFFFSATQPKRFSKNNKNFEIPQNFSLSVSRLSWRKADVIETMKWNRMDYR